MKKQALITLLLMMTLLGASALAQMNYELINPNLVYEKLAAGEGMPVLIDIIDEAIDPEDVPDASSIGIIGGWDGPTAIYVTESAEKPADVWPKTFTVTLAGDTTLGSTDDLRKRDDCFERVAEERGYGWFFSGLTELFGSDDMTLINFEGTLTEETQKKEKKFNFKGPAEYTDILTMGSVEAVTVANNHTLDYGTQGRDDTIANLEGAGVTVSGNGQLAVFEKDSVKVGMTGYCFPYKDGRKDISKDVKALREMGCQIVIASFHWGSEYREDFTGEQRSIGRAAIKAGADFVVGHHPHIVQGVEKYEDTYIAYSVGNLVFGGNVDPDDRDAAAIRLTFTVNETEVEDMEMAIVPLRLTELSDGTDYRPIVAKGEEADRIVNRILRRSSNMSGFENPDWKE